MTDSERPPICPSCRSPMADDEISSDGKYCKDCASWPGHPHSAPSEAGRAPSPVEAVHPRLRWYFDHPGAWEDIKQAILDHDPSCASLPDLWTGHTGGVSCPGEQADCDDCEVTFYNEGLMGQYGADWKTGYPIMQTKDEDGGEYEARLCDCCGRKRLTAPASTLSDTARYGEESS